MHPYLVEGIGKDTFPASFDPSVVDDYVRVSDRDSFLMTRRLAREEGILAGGSGGTSVHAMLEVAKRFGPEATILTTIPDGGRGYLSKIFDDNWMLEHGFLERRGPPDTVEQVLAFKHAENGVPDLVVCESHQKLGAAIELMQRYGISQLPVVRNAPAESLADVIGSLNERVLLDRVFRNPDALGEEVAAAMQPPLGRPSSWRHGRPGLQRPARPAPGRRRRAGQARGRAHALRPARVPRAPPLMRLYNSQLSGNCYKARLLLALLGIPYERIELDVIDRSNRRTSSSAARTPPCACRRSSSTTASTWPSRTRSSGTSPTAPRTSRNDPLDRARVLQWMFFEQYEVEPTIAVARFWITVLGEQEKYAAELEGKWRAGNRALAALDEHLGGREWLVGDAYSVADISLYGYTHVADEGGFDLAQYPSVAGVARPGRRPPGARPDRGIARLPGVVPGGGDGLARQLRRYVVAHQGYATRFRRGRAADVAATIRRLGCVQLDSISTVDRAHRLTLTSRIGAYPEAAVSRL